MYIHEPLLRLVHPCYLSVVLRDSPAMPVLQPEEGLRPGVSLVGGELANRGIRVTHPSICDPVASIAVRCTSGKVILNFWVCVV